MTTSAFPLSLNGFQLLYHMDVAAPLSQVSSRVDYGGKEQHGGCVNLHRARDVKIGI
jgi:hypothetical protein